jgi:hypothetical protein
LFEALNMTFGLFQMGGASMPQSGRRLQHHSRHCLPYGRLRLRRRERSFQGFSRMNADEPMIEPDALYCTTPYDGEAFPRSKL